MMAPGVSGTVSAINGTTLTVAAMGRPTPEKTAATAVTAPTTMGTVYTVDASSAKIYKGSATTTVSISSIAVGDKVMVQGTVSGTNVVATVIRDGIGGAMGGKGFGGRGTSSTPSTTPVIQGNGEPIVGGSITAISGASLTVTNASNVTYTIDATNAKIVKSGATSTISAVAIGDTVIVQGTVNGTSVTASSVIDQGVKSTNGSSANTPSAGSHGGGLGGFFGAIGGFFKHLFGF